MNKFMNYMFKLLPYGCCGLFILSIYCGFMLENVIDYTQSIMIALLSVCCMCFSRCDIENKIILALIMLLVGLLALLPRLFS